MGLLTWFLFTQLLNRFFLTWLLTLFAKEHITPITLKGLMGFWKLSVCGGNTGGAEVVSSWFLRWFGLGTKAFL
jgi:hypothetical protein